MDAYLKHWRCIGHSEDEQLFLYFKAYRANVSLKVALMELEQHRTDALVATAKLYWDLLDRYMAQLIC